ncbi:MAG: SAM-dependent methyltransferase [Planctomycetota bacterium]|nr:SAM-dependent methyltransferase [Planctomycetota bacterium]
MPFELDRIVPWGRSYGEYLRMFALGEAELRGKILDVAGGPASFVAEHAARGGYGVSCDPLYAHTSSEIQERIDATYETVLEQARANRGQFVWKEFRDPDDLGRARRAAMAAFLSDYPLGVAEGRYRAEELPQLQFPEGAFDLALCSHFLFLYGEHCDLEFHRQSIAELLRVAREVRVFPLLGLDGLPSPHLEPLRAEWAAAGLGVSVEQVPYEFQRGGNRLLRIRKE